MMVELPLLLALVAGSFFLARVWLSPMAAMVTALLVALNEDVSSYALMLHFAVPTAAALVWAFYFYIRCRHFHDWTWSVIFGVSIAVMLLARSMSIVYVVPLAAVVGIDLVVDIRKNGQVLRPPALGAVAAALVLAGPWWLVSGHTAIHYLQNAGYQPSSGYTTRGVALDTKAVEQRASWTLSELGWSESWALTVALLAALWLVVWRRHTLRLTALWMLAMWVLLTSFILSSSANAGTGYGLPVIVILIVLAGAVLGQMSWRIFPVLGVILGGVLAIGLVAESADVLEPWWATAPYHHEVDVAGGNTRTDTDLMAAQVARLIGSSPTLVALDSDILNTNAIQWNAGPTPPSLFVPPSTANGTQVAVRDLAGVKFAITGSSPGSYRPLVDQSAVETSAARDGFHVVRMWSTSPAQSIVVWQRGGTARTISLPPPITRMFRPRDGTDVSGDVYLVANSSDRLATTGVDFVVSGLARAPAVAAHSSVAAHPFVYGWIGVLHTATLPDGTYTIQSVAVDAAGGVGRSRPVTVHVDNQDN